MVVLLGDPADPGRWRSRTEIEVGPGPRGLLLADLDGDGVLDIATADARVGRVTVVLDPLSPSAAGSSFEATTGASGIAAGDLNGDGLPDLAVTGRRDAVVLFQDPQAPGTFLPPVTVAPDAFPSSVALADVDGDGGMDIVLGLAKGGIGVLLQDPGTPGTFPVFVPVQTPGRGTGEVVATDLDGDGRTDIACALRGLPRGGGGTGLAILLQDPAVPMTFHSTLLDPFQRLRTLQALDMDGDGTVDLLASGGGRVVWYRQDPANRGRFKRRGHRIVQSAEGGVAGADFDQDGLVDAVAAFYRPYLLRQDSVRPGRFLPPRRFRE